MFPHCLPKKVGCYFFFKTALSWEKYNIDNSGRTFPRTHCATGYGLCWGLNLEEMSLQWDPCSYLALLEPQQQYITDLTLNFLFNAQLFAGSEDLPCLTSLFWCRQTLWASTRLRLFLRNVKQDFCGILPPASAMARATFMHDLWSYESLVIEWPFLPWGLGGESSCWKSGSLLHSIKSPAGSCTGVIPALGKKQGKWQVFFLVSVTMNRLKFVIFFFLLNKVFTSDYLLKLWHKIPAKKTNGRNSPYPPITLSFVFWIFSRSRHGLNYLPRTEQPQSDYCCFLFV